jgi:hypothetical protein
MKNYEDIHDMLVKTQKHDNIHRKGFINASKEKEALE